METINDSYMYCGNNIQLNELSCNGNTDFFPHSVLQVMNILVLDLELLIW